jgi:hypothetical protein
MSMALSADGKTLAGGIMDGTVKLWDLATGREVRSFKGHASVTGTHNAAGMAPVAFSRDDKTLASGGYDESVKLWDVESGRELHTLKGHSGNVTSLVFSGDGKILISGSGDATLKLWEIATGRELATLVTTGTRDSLVIAPDGLFDGSPAAWNKILWRFSAGLYDYAPVEWFFNDFYYPGLLGEITAGGRPRASQDIARKDRRQPRVRLSPADPRAASAPVGTREVGVRVEVDDAPAGAQDVRLFRNGSLVHVWRGDVLKGRGSATLEATIPIVAGENRLTAYAFNRDNIKSADATLTVSGADPLRRAGVLYLLAVGVNEYANPEFNLKYAVPDARVFGEEWRRQQGALRRYERIEVTSLQDAGATKAAIVGAFAELAKKVQPEDALVFYFAGHGVAHRSQFYLIPHDLGYGGGRDALDAAGLEVLIAHGVSDRELEQLYEKVDAGQLLLVIDACNSGQALEAEEKRRGPMNSKGLAQLAYEKGMYVLTAAQSYQAALEAAHLGHGFLTYALVEEGLKGGKADEGPKDGQVLVREWLDFAAERVPRMQEEAMLEFARGRGLKLAFVQGEERIQDPGARSVQRPRAFYRRELEARPLVVARTAPP